MSSITRSSRKRETEAATAGNRIGKRRRNDGSQIVSQASISQAPVLLAAPQNWLAMRDTIVFGGGRKTHAWLSNFHPCEITIGGKAYHHAEGYFQASKFTSSPAVAERIRAAVSPAFAKALGRKNCMTDAELTAWNGHVGKEGCRMMVMRQAVRAKFADEELRAKLLATGDSILVEQSRGDKFWACGARGLGENHLGRMLMDLRAELREELGAGEGENESLKV